MNAQNDIKIWKDFVENLKKGELTSDEVRPYNESLKAPLIELLASLRSKVSWEEFEATPEVHRVHDQVCYLIPLTFDGHKDTYCFTLLIQGDKWYFRHIESIFIRLDKIAPLPTSTFPDISEGQKAWIREEFLATEQVRLFNFLSKDKGRDFAFSWFKDGAGYFLATRAWVPFISAPKAFIVYACWEQAILKGNSVTLEKMEDDEAIVRMGSIYLELYARATHLRQEISLEDYRQILETRWKDRASNAGWDLRISYKQGECLFHFDRKSQKEA